MTPERVAAMNGSQLHRFSWIPDEQIGNLPIEWNWLCQEHGENPYAKLIHYTIGVPAFRAYKDDPHASDFNDCLRRVNFATS